MESYHNIIRQTAEEGVRKPTRTGIHQYSITGIKFEHQMSEGFPLITTREVDFSKVTSELEFFIKGLTDKTWLQDRGNNQWNPWANPQKAPYGQDIHSQKKMALERDLGPIYGFQWRHFGAKYEGCNKDYSGQGTDQLESLVKGLKNNPSSKRHVVSCWNPMDLDKMALPPCHYAFHTVVQEDKLDLIWNQRGADIMLGVPQNIACYGTLLHLLAKETGLKEGKLVGMLDDVHYYENQAEKVKEILERDPKRYSLPKIRTENFSSIFDWKYTDTVLENYQSYPKMRIKIAI